MELHASLYEIAKLLLSDDDSERTAEILLQRVLETTGADRGFIVVREGNSFEQKFDVRFSRERISEEEHRFSRSLVRQALRTQELIYSRNLQLDPRFAELESVQAMGNCSVLVAPLRHDGEIYGVMYLQRGGLEGFPEEAKPFISEFTALAGMSLRRALEREELRARSRSLERDLFSKYNFKGIITRHRRMLDLLKTVAQVADSDATVLLLGETGTGKELIAQALHANSSRRKRPFVSLHCAALPGTILESELFGHVRGAFTGAERERPGRIASAEGGTLLLDEVAEIPLELQAKLLRFLQFGEIQRLGSDRVEKVDVRVVAATHQDIASLIKAGKFRQDLYYRLKVIELHVPALRERSSDVPLLLEHFVRRSWKRPAEQPRWSARAEAALCGHAWPGNVRELEHVVERACLLASGAELDLELLPPEVRPSNPAAPWSFQAHTNAELKAAREDAIRAVERDFLAGLLRRCEGNASRAARESGINRTYLHKLMAEHRFSSIDPV